MSKFLKKELQDLAPYTPGEQPQTNDYIKLNTNENPYPPSPEVKRAISELDSDEYRLYPDPDDKKVVKVISKYYNLNEKQIMLGNGSDELIAFAYMAYSGDVYFPETSYGFYQVFGQVFGCVANLIKLNDDLTINPEDYVGVDGTIVIANPNAPTGSALSRKEIEIILKGNPNNIVIIDEAYVDFGAETCVPLIEKYNNLLVIQTFSKSRSLAGMRIGMAMGNEEIISDLNRIKFSFNPYNLSTEAIIAASAAIKDEDYFQMQRKQVMKTREMFVSEMERLGYEVLPSKANFVFVKTGAEYFEKLKEKKILVRHWDKEALKDYVRITIGREEDMKELVRVTEEIQ